MNTEMLREAIKSAGYTMKAFADALDVSPSTLHKKMAGESEFTRVQIVNMARLLNLPSGRVHGMCYDPKDIFSAIGATRVVYYRTVDKGQSKNQGGIDHD